MQSVLGVYENVPFSIEMRREQGCVLIFFRTDLTSERGRRLTLKVSTMGVYRTISGLDFSSPEPRTQDEELNSK